MAQRAEMVNAQETQRMGPNLAAELEQETSGEDGAPPNAAPGLEAPKDAEGKCPGR